MRFALFHSNLFSLLFCLYRPSFSSNVDSFRKIKSSMAIVWTRGRSANTIRLTCDVSEQIDSYGSVV